MPNRHSGSSGSHEQLLIAIQNETRKFQEYYVWLEKAMPEAFFEEVSQDNVMLVAHSLMGFHQQEYFSVIRLKSSAIVLCLDSADADIRILKNFSMHGIKYYESFISESAPPIENVYAKLRVANIIFTEFHETIEKGLSLEHQELIHKMTFEEIPEITDLEFNELMAGINMPFLRAIPVEKLMVAFKMYFRAKTRDSCQYEVHYNQNWEEANLPSMQIILAWRNTPKHNFLYRLASVIHRHGLFMKKVNSTYINPNSNNSVQIMSIGLHGSNGKAVWDVAEIPDFLREFATVKYFGANDEIESSLVNKGFLGGTMGNLLRAISCFVHQALVHIDPNLFSSEHVEHALCRHPELTVQLLETFRRKFDPDLADLESFQKLRERFLISVDKLDTGNEENDYLRKSVLRMAMSFITHCLKTNFYRLNYTAFSFRLDPSYLDDIPFERSTKFPELPYGIFFIKGMNFFGFHIRFKDLARGGLRTVFPDLPEVVKAEENNVFAECYNLAYTQQMKNKDIPEGGAKAIIFISPSEQMEAEVEIFKDELVFAGIPEAETESQVVKFRQEQKLEYLYQAQRCFVESLVIIINCDSEGKIRARQIIDYWKRPEYLYLGPDENMHDTIIQWIADYSEKYHYKPGSAFISSKPLVGINHKEYGVTSLGVNVYLEETLKFLGIDPKRETFTIKMSGGPDGDVAGNEILNLLEFYPETAKLVALTDISGTIRDPSGLDLEVLKTLFHQSKPIRHYPPHKLHEGGFLLDRFTKRSQTELSQQTLCYRASQGQVIEDWLSGSEMNSLYRNNLHQMKADVFLPAGGRPRTLNESNYKDFLDETGKPTAKAIIEGANLYLTQRARRNLEKLGVLIIKDSSANKCGVICSSFEVLSGLALGDELFLKEKESLVKEILARLHELALLEATLLLSTHKATGEYLTDISEKVSQRINFFTYQILDFLDQNSPSHDPNDPAVQCFLSYCLPTLTAKYQDRLLKEIPEHHKKAIIASLIGANLVYNRGLEWSPSVVDILPLLLNIVVDTKK